MRFFNEHQLLLMRRESSVVIGRKAVNLWLLVAVLVATFFAISFSEGSIRYLEDKMDDPFTLWVNIDLHGVNDRNTLERALDDDSIRGRFLFDGWQTEDKSSISIVGIDDDKIESLEALYYGDVNSDIYSAILGEDNVVNNIAIKPGNISPNSLGLILSVEAFEKLGFSINHPPAFIDHYIHSPGAEKFGIDMLNGDYARVPLPLLAVVRRLPMNKDLVASKYFYQRQIDKEKDPLSLNKEDYSRELYFFVPDNVNSFGRNDILRQLDDSLRYYVDPKYTVLVADDKKEMLYSWRSGNVYKVYLRDASVPMASVKRIEKQIMDAYASQGVVRVYGFDPTIGDEWGNSNENSHWHDDIISVHFTRLDSITSFRDFVKKVSELEIEMTQVNAKKNFGHVSRMATVLTIALLLFAIASIAIFIVNMLQSYFQKVRRNLGTLKAFGISTRELTKVYVTIIVGIVMVALAIALASAWAAELLLLLCGFTKEGKASHLILWNGYTLLAVLIILASTVASVLVVLYRQLKQTPGNLIYDRE